MNIDNAVELTYEGNAGTEISSTPISATQVIAHIPQRRQCTATEYCIASVFDLNVLCCRGGICKTFPFGWCR